MFDVPAIGIGPANGAFHHVDGVEFEVPSGAFGECDLCLIGVGRREIKRAILRRDAEIAQFVVNPIEEIEDVVVGSDARTDGSLGRLYEVVRLPFVQTRRRSGKMTGTVIPFRRRVEPLIMPGIDMRCSRLRCSSSEDFSASNMAV